MEPNQKDLYFQIFQMNLLAFVVAIARHQMLSCFPMVPCEFYGKYKENLTQRMVDQTLADIYSDNKSWNVYFTVPLAEWVIQLNFESCTDLWECKSLTLESATAHSLWMVIVLWIVSLGMSWHVFCDFSQIVLGFSPLPLFPIERWLFSEPQKLQLLFFWVVFCCREFHSQGLISIPEQWPKK